MKKCPYCGSEVKESLKWTTYYKCGTEAPIDWTPTQSDKCKEIANDNR